MDYTSIANYIPRSLLGYYQSMTHPLEEEEVKVSLVYAKYKELRSLSDLLIEMDDFSCPTQIGQKVQEFVHIFKNTDSYQKLSLKEQREITSLLTLDVSQLIFALRDYKIAGASLEEYLEEESTLNLQINNTSLRNTDLIVFSDYYYGPLPENGIHERDYLAASDLYERIVANKTAIQIEGSSNFKLRVQSLIKRLLTRNEGRELIESLTATSWLDSIPCCAPWGETEIRIEPTAKKSSAEHFTHYYDSRLPFVKKNAYHVILSLSTQIETWTEFPQGLSKSTLPKIIELAHELIHLRHFMRRDKWESLDQKELDGYTSEEERVTITGQLNQAEQDSLNENAFRRAFGLFPRKFH